MSWRLDTTPDASAVRLAISLVAAFLLCLYVGCGEKASREKVPELLPGNPVVPDRTLEPDAEEDITGEVGEGVPLKIQCCPLGMRSSTVEMGPRGYRTCIAGMFSGAAISFSFWGEESPVEGRVTEAYRFYWDSPDVPSWQWTSPDSLRDPGRRPEWRVNFPSDGSRFVPTLGRHVFVAQLRDTGGAVTHCEFNLEVLAGPRGAPENKILLIDDNVDWWLGSYSTYTEGREDSLWFETLDGYNFGVFDTFESPGDPYDRHVPIRFINTATTVIWHVDMDTEDPMTCLTHVTSLMANYLYPYVLLGGNVIIIGCNPIYAHQFWPDWTRLDFSSRGDHDEFDFSPRCPNPGCESMLYNFNWEVFGIEGMRLPESARWWDKLIPCDPMVGPDTLFAVPADPLTPWDGYCSVSPFEVTDLRDDIMVYPLYAAATFDPGTGEYDNIDCSRLVAIYVPGDGDRGHAAYIGFPPWYFDNDGVIAFFRDLLEEFGEMPIAVQPRAGVKRRL